MNFNLSSAIAQTTINKEEFAATHNMIPKKQDLSRTKQGTAEGMNTRSKRSTPGKIAVSTSKNVLGTNQNIFNTSEVVSMNHTDEKNLGKRLLQSFAHDQASSSIAYSVQSRKRDSKATRKDKENSKY